MTLLGPHMAAEMREAAGVFSRAVVQDVPALTRPAAIYTFARGSSDTVANVLSYAFMAQLGLPMTSLPPSVFSLINGVSLDRALSLIISQSGASDDLVACARQPGAVIAITNVPGSPVEAAANSVVRVDAGPELAVPATKSVVGSIAAGMALLAAIDPGYRGACEQAAASFAAGLPDLPDIAAKAATLSQARHVYVLGRLASFGVAQETALKLKETCAIHAEAYSASEVLHGPLQLSTRALTVISLDSADPVAQPSLRAAEERFAAEGATILRICPDDIGLPHMAQPAMAAALLCMIYPLIHATANHLGLNPDAPTTLKKVTSTI